MAQEACSRGPAQFGCGLGPVERDTGGNDESIFCGIDCRLKQFIQTLATVMRQQHLPGRKSARDSHAMGRLCFQRGHTYVRKRLHRDCRGRPTGAIDSDQRLSCRLIKAEAISTNPSRLWLNDAKKRDRSNRCIERVAPCPENINRGQARRRHGGRGHTVGRIDRAATCKLEITHQKPRKGSASLGDPKWRATGFIAGIDEPIEIIKELGLIFTG